MQGEEGTAGLGSFSGTSTGRPAQVALPAWADDGRAGSPLRRVRSAARPVRSHYRGKPAPRHSPGWSAREGGREDHIGGVGVREQWRAVQSEKVQSKS